MKVVRPASRRNPHLRADRQRFTHRRATQPLWEKSLNLAILMTTVGILAPLFEATFLSFLSLPKSAWTVGLEGILIRVCFVFIGLVALDTYTGLIRGEARNVLELLPVDGAQVLSATFVDILRRRSWLILAIGWLWRPVATSMGITVWCLSMVLFIGVGFLALAIMACAHLLAVKVASQSRWVALLDAFRGSNPRQQAAFIYAPGLGLMMMGALLVQLAKAVSNTAGGDGISGLWFSLPFILGVMVYSFAKKVAQQHWFDATPVLSEIDGRYRAVEEQEDAMSVYLDWTTRWLPRAAGVYALKDLRCGWRSVRILVSGVWLAGIAVCAWFWMGDGVVQAEAVGVFVGGIWLGGALGVVLPKLEPEFLRVWLPDNPKARRIGRAFVLFMWTQPVVLLGALGIFLVDGGMGAIQVMGLGWMCTVTAICVAMASSYWYRNAVLIYAPVAVFCSLGSMVWLGGI
jgi:hypothetical protein